MQLQYFSGSGCLVAETTGGVSPLAWNQPVTMVIDESLNDYDVIWAAAGRPHAVFPTSFKELQLITAATSMKGGK